MGRRNPRDGARTIADQPVDPHPHESRAGRDVDGPREHEPGDRAELGDHAVVEKALVDRDAVEPLPREPIEKRAELATAPTEATRRTGSPSKASSSRHERAQTVKRRPGRYGSSSARTTSASRIFEPLRSSISPDAAPRARRSSDNTSRGLSGEASSHRSHSGRGPTVFR